MYDKANIRPASDPKLCFARVVISANDMFLPSTTDNVHSVQLTMLALPYVVRHNGLLQLFFTVATPSGGFSEPCSAPLRKVTELLAVLVEEIYPLIQLGGLEQ